MEVNGKIEKKDAWCIGIIVLFFALCDLNVEKISLFYSAGEDVNLD